MIIRGKRSCPSTFTPFAAEPYKGRLTVSGIDGVGKLERSYESGKLNGAETAWSESGEKENNHAKACKAERLERDYRSSG
jgi:hypothetical protein